MIPVVPARSLFRVLLGVAVLLCGTSLVLRLMDPALDGGPTDPDLMPFGGYRRLTALLSVDVEANIPTWFSVALLLVAALLLWGIATSAHRSRDRWRWHWSGLAVVFAYLSCDEAAGLHELPMEFIDLDGALAFSWVVVAAPLVLLLAVGYLPFVLAQPARPRALLVASAALFLGGAIGMEMVGAAISGGEDFLTTPYVLVNTVEEFLEMAGVSLFVYVLARSSSPAVADHRGHLPDDGVAQEPVRAASTT